MSSPSSERQDGPSSGRDVRRSSSSVGSVQSSTHVKDPRRLALAGRPTLDRRPSSTIAGEDALGAESGPSSTHRTFVVASKHLRRTHHSSPKGTLSSAEILQPNLSDTQSSGTAIPSHSAAIHCAIRPLSLAPKSPQLGGTSDKGRTRKECSRAAALGDSRHVKHPVSLQLLRSAPRSEVPSEADKGGLALVDTKPILSNSMAAASWEHMQRELEHLRRTVQEYHKNSRKQAKRIEDLSTQAMSHHKAIHDKDQELVSLQQKCSKLEKHISAVEGAVQCQICMDLPEKPYTLAPCGHVLCLSCLQEWFKTALGPVDDDEDEAEAGNVVDRDKTCPCCRTVVKHRPCPAFMVKEIVSTFSKGNNAAQVVPGDAIENADDDPWEGIFPNSDIEEPCDLEDFSDEEDEFGIDFSWMATDRGSAPGFVAWTYGTDSEDGAYTDDDENDDEVVASEGSISEDDYGHPNSYVEPRWEPPTVHVDPNLYHLEPQDDALSLLRRGCTWDMVQNFHIRYTHRQGIVVSLRSIDQLYISDDDGDSSDEEGSRESIHHLYLGWNIRLEEDDIDGEAFMLSMLADIKDRPERWRLVPKYDGRGSMDVTRLVPAEQLEEYYTTDTDSHLEQDTRDMDID